MYRPILIAILLGTLTSCGGGDRAPVANVAGADDMPMPDGSRADMTAVMLYPGSIMRQSAKIMPHEIDDMTHFTFVSPAAPGVVRAWFAGDLARGGYRLKSDGGSLVGTDPQGKPFRLDLADAPGGRTMGVISKG